MLFQLLFYCYNKRGLLLTSTPLPASQCWRFRHWHCSASSKHPPSASVSTSGGFSGCPLGDGVISGMGRPASIQCQNTSTYAMPSHFRMMFNYSWFLTSPSHWERLQISPSHLERLQTWPSLRLKKTADLALTLKKTADISLRTAPTTWTWPENAEVKEDVENTLC